MFGMGNGRRGLGSTEEEMDGRGGGDNESANQQLKEAAQDRVGWGQMWSESSPGDEIEWDGVRCGQESSRGDEIGWNGVRCGQETSPGDVCVPMKQGTVTR